jgi:hypothetical protein
MCCTFNSEKAEQVYTNEVYKKMLVHNFRPFSILGLFTFDLYELQPCLTFYLL